MNTPGIALFGKTKRTTPRLETLKYGTALLLRDTSVCRWTHACALPDIGPLARACDELTWRITKPETCAQDS